MITYAPYTGFGDDPNTAVKFGIRRSNQYTAPDWSGGPRETVKRIPGSSRVNIRTTGRDPYTVSFRLHFQTHDEFERFNALQGTTATLRYPWGVTKTVGGTYDYRAGVAYLAIPGVRLMSLTDEEIGPEYAEVTATFMKEAAP